MADIGGVTLQSRTANGSADGGAVVRLAATVLINAPSRFAPLATGVGDAESLSRGAVTLLDRTTTGVAAEGSVSDAAVTRENTTAFGYTPGVSIAQRKALTATGIALSGTTAIGAAVFRPYDTDAAATGQGIGFGAPVRQTIIALGRSAQQSLATANILLLRRQAQGIGLNGTVASGLTYRKIRTATGIASGPATADGTSIRPYAFINGFSEPVISQNYRTWVANISNEALTEYTNHAFNSYAFFNGKYYAAGIDGLFELTGTTDNNVEIPWSIRTGFMDDKNMMLKRLHELVIGVRHDAPVRVRVYTDETTFYDYTLANFRDELQQVRLKTGKGLKSRYFRIELSSMGGTKFEVDSLQVPFIPVTRRIG